MVAITTSFPTIQSLDDWMQHPPDRTEWIAGQLVEKNGMTLKHSRIQAKLATYWRNFLSTQQVAGEVYTEVPCCTEGRGRSPDVAYLTPELVDRYGNETVLPQSFPLTAEIISPTDYAEDVIAKGLEYLRTGALEVWLVYPEVGWVVVMTEETRQIFVSGDTVATKMVLSGFQLAVDEFLK
ncbi:MAG: Uma2 family endonuclease [Cyanobacteria bacterium SID2]|nr:Uma2 family endonuclease [Cyanobacteria bacterium SID2]